MLLANILLALAWTALQGELSLANLVLGYVLGYLVLQALTRGGVLDQKFGGKVAAFFRLLLLLVWELVLANIRLTRDVVSPNHEMSPGVVRVPLDVRADGEILLLSALINLTPGSVVLDVSEDRRLLYVHVMHMKTPEQSRDEIKSGFERRVLELMR